MNTGIALTNATPASRAGLGVEAGGVLGPHREVRHEHVGLRVAQGLRHVDGLLGGFVDLVDVVLAEAVEGRAAEDLDAEVRHVGELDRVVLAGPHRLRDVEADLRRVDVEHGDELDVADVVSAEIDVHQAGDLEVGLRVPVVLDSLDQGVRAVTEPCDGYSNGGHGFLLPSWFDG
jgi:hypothetical protein